MRYPAFLGVSFLLILASNSFAAETAKPKIKIYDFPVVSSKSGRVVLEGDFSKVEVGSVLKSPAGTSGKIILIRERMAVLEVEGGDGIKAGDMFRFTDDPEAKKRGEAERLIEETLVKSDQKVEQKQEQKASEVAVEVNTSQTSYPRIDQFGYMPLRDQVVMDLSLDVQASNHFEFKSASGVKFLDLSNNSAEAELALGYAISDNLVLGAEATVLIRNETKNNPIPTGTATRTNREGFADPSVGGIYRYHANPERGEFGKLTFKVSPGILKNKPPTTTDTGNAGRGGTFVGVAGDFSWLRGRGEWKTALELNYLTRQTIQSTPQTTNDALLAAQARGAYRLHFDDSFYLQPGLGFTLPYSEVSTDTSIVTIEHPLAVTFAAEFGFLLSKNFLIYTGASYSSYTADGTIQSGSTITKGSVDVSSFGLSVGTQVVF